MVSMWAEGESARGSSRILGAAKAAVIANTDFGWLSHFLHRAKQPDEVDFWQPSPHGFNAIPPGAPFFFRLGAPHRAIAGYGFFARYEFVPVWLAWGGAFAEMTARIEAIRCRTESALRRDVCLLISAAERS